MMKYLFTFLVFFLPATAGAATLSLTQLPATVGVGDVVKVTLSVQSSDSVNAFSGILNFSDALVPMSVSDGHSIVPLWVESPHIASLGVIFAGTVPNGFRGSGTLLSVLFRARAAGEASADIADIQILSNDGKGTPVSVTHTPLSFKVQTLPQGGYSAPQDVVPPQAFAPLVAIGPDGKQYLLFATTDAGSGIQKYEVLEHRPFGLGPSAPHVVSAQSPYQLDDQFLSSDIEVRAIDAAGNVRIEVYPHTHAVRPYEEGLLIAILIGVVVSIYLYFRRHVSLSWTNSV